MNFILKNDLGVIAKGTKMFCIDELIKWCGTEEAKLNYKKNELIEIKKYFIENYKIGKDTISKYGFTLKE